jgi:rSAM/selenodomain-associated transferase 2
LTINKNPFLSIIIPTLNEAANLTSTLTGIPKIPEIEVIVADGGSGDETCRLADEYGARIIPSPRGRAEQMNTGAGQAQGELLLFLHADTKLPEGFMEPVLQILSRPGVAAGAFQLKLDPPLPGLKSIERLANWRARVWQRPYGDQGLFLRKDRFRSIDGFPEIPIMEDIELIRRLRRQGRIVIVPLPAVSSSRRWLESGVLKTTLRNQIALLGYGIGISPDHLARWYHKKKASRIQGAKGSSGN